MAFAIADVLQQTLGWVAKILLLHASIVVLVVSLWFKPALQH